MFNSRVRNTLEHFDEYLDDAVLEYESGELEKKAPMALYNVNNLELGVITPAPYPIRLYVSEERKFYNMGHAIDIGALYAEAQAIRARVQDLMRRAPVDTTTDSPGGLMIPLGRRREPPRPA